MMWPRISKRGSTDGTPLGIGRYTYDVLSLADYEEKLFVVAEFIWKLGDCHSAANGALMKTSILGTSPLVDEQEMVDICRLTHPDPRFAGSCVILVRLIQELIFHDRQMTADELMPIGKKYDPRITEYIQLSLVDDPVELQVDVKAIGYTLTTQALALWCLWHAKDLKDGLLIVVNLGGDADTNAAVACSLMGAKFGFGNIPEYYVEHLRNGEVLVKVFLTLD